MQEWFHISQLNTTFNASIVLHFGSKVTTCTNISLAKIDFKLISKKQVNFEKDRKINQKHKSKTIVSRRKVNPTEDIEKAFWKKAQL